MTEQELCPVCHGTGWEDSQLFGPCSNCQDSGPVLPYPAANNEIKTTVQ